MTRNSAILIHLIFVRRNDKIMIKKTKYQSIITMLTPALSVLSTTKLFICPEKYSHIVSLCSFNYYIFTIEDDTFSLCPSASVSIRKSHDIIIFLALFLFFVLIITNYKIVVNFLCKFIIFF